MQLMLLMLIIFLLISMTGFVGALLFGVTGATALIVLGLCISFIGIAFFTGQ